MRIYIVSLILILSASLQAQNPNELDKKLGFQNVKLYSNFYKYYKDQFYEFDQQQERLPYSKTLLIQNNFYKTNSWSPNTSRYHIGSIPVYLKLVIDNKSKVIEEIWIENIPYTPSILKTLEQLYGKGLRTFNPIPVSKGLYKYPIILKYETNRIWKGQKVSLQYVEFINGSTNEKEISLFYRIPGYIRTKMNSVGNQDVEKLKGDL